MKNYEIRFRVSSELYYATLEFYKNHFNNFKRTGFLEKVFLLGLNNLKEQLRKQNKVKQTTPTKTN
jgi:hypothetical protein